MFGNAKSDKLKPVHFRVFAPSDLDACVELYRSNEGSFIPPRGITEFAASLSDGTSLHLIGELEGQIIATGAVLIGPEPRSATLCWGLVRADRHRQGLGTTLLAARMAMMDVPADGMWVQLFAVSSSYTFYERCGFSLAGVHEDEHGERIGVMRLALWPKQAQQIRNRLAVAGVRLPTDYQIPEVRFLPLDEADPASVQEGRG